MLTSRAGAVTLRISWMNASCLLMISIICPGERSARRKVPSGPVEVDCIPSVIDIVAIMTLSRPTPPRVTRPVTSTPGSMTTSTGFIPAATLCARSVFAAYPSAFTTTS